MTVTRVLPAGLLHLLDLAEPVVRPDVVAAARARLERDGSVSALLLAGVLLEHTRFATRF
ncbi:MAG: hypothetical protein QOJ67_915 [Acidimicrobiaceae bacterium]|jgi:hypothetical protein